MNMPQFSSDGASRRAGHINSQMVVGGIIALALLIFIFQNTRSTSVHFLFFSFRLPLWLLIAVTAILGGLLDGVVGRGIRRLRGKDTPKQP